jgi:uncharacterized protein YkwD
MNQSTLSWILQFTQLHNQIRMNYSLPLLIINETLIDLAKLQCHEMYEQNRVFHNHVIVNGGQNILFSTDIDYYYNPQKILYQWFHDISHRNILLDPYFKNIGSFAVLGNQHNYFVSNYN